MVWFRNIFIYHIEVWRRKLKKRKEKRFRAFIGLGIEHLGGARLRLFQNYWVSIEES
jgi:hypothetical protein